MQINGQNSLVYSWGAIKQAFFERIHALFASYGLLCRFHNCTGYIPLNGNMILEDNMKMI